MFVIRASFFAAIPDIVTAADTELTTSTGDYSDHTQDGLCCAYMVGFEHANQK